MDVRDYIAGQLRCPHGHFGRAMGLLMRHVNHVPNAWAISLLGLRPTDHVLEVGFGPGAAIKWISGFVSEGLVCGIDYSQVMLQQACALNAKAVASGLVNLRRCDAAALPYEENKFDRVLSVNVVYFWPEPVAAFKEMRRVLKPGGLLVIYFTSPGSLRLFKTLRKDVFVKRSSEHIVQMILEAGFRKVHCENRSFRVGRRIVGTCVLAEK